jgi:hypothetical protein
LATGRSISPFKGSAKINSIVERCGVIKQSSQSKEDDKKDKVVIFGGSSINGAAELNILHMQLFKHNLVYALTNYHHGSERKLQAVARGCANDRDGVITSYNVLGRSVDLQQGYNVLILEDQNLDYTVEEQAKARIARFGQKKNVYVYRCIVAHTLEESFRAVRMNKELRSKLFWNREAGGYKPPNLDENIAILQAQAIVYDDKEREEVSKIVQKLEEGAGTSTSKKQSSATHQPKTSSSPSKSPAKSGQKHSTHTPNSAKSTVSHDKLKRKDNKTKQQLSDDSEKEEHIKPKKVGVAKKENVLDVERNKKRGAADSVRSHKHNKRHVSSDSENEEKSRVVKRVRKDEEDSDVEHEDKKGDDVSDAVDSDLEDSVSKLLSEWERK